MLTQGEDCFLVSKQIKEACQCHPETFQKPFVSAGTVLRGDTLDLGSWVDAHSFSAYPAT